ncbi:MAG: tripartite tricarboxylate transporter TctB family protein [Fusobacterium sp.]|uniref:tripartite tricarboxylate transporter TctB family protein n=1 Tax=Fusobacterium sp. TaxID=68766 RepID=UPI0026DC4F48|nr:tripartite tricarboxylate transporter TctB family protein [Fusobacterium sp.]MDO4690199.1 tripartite tricarboxylate transporter TctB family protein [Fusobacterium sp.]
MKKYDKILTIALLILEVFYFILIKQLPEKAARYPYFVLGLLVFLTIILAINAFVIKAKDDEEESDKFKDVKIGQFLFIIFASAAYIALIEIVGFFTTTVVYLLIVMLGLKNSVKWSVITSILFPIFIYFVFVSFLRVPVPKGFLI